MADEEQASSVEVAVHEVYQSIEEPTQSQIQPVSETSTGKQEKAAEFTAAVSSSVQSDENSRKLFVGALSRDTSEEGLREYFEKYGTIETCMVKLDPVTKRSRGFGFVTFADASSIDRVTSSGPHILDERTIDPKLAFPFGASHTPRVKKIFLGGLPAELSEEQLREHFSQFGTVDLVELPFDRDAGVRRGFGFVSFELEDSVESAVKLAYHTIGNYTVQVKRATPREQQSRAPARGGGMGGGFPHRGGLSTRGRDSSMSSRGGWGGGASYGGGYGGYGAYSAAAYQAAYQAYGGYGGYGGYGAYGGYGGYGAYGGYGGYDYSQQYNLGGDNYSQYGAMRNNPYSQSSYRPY